MSAHENDVMMDEAGGFGRTRDVKPVAIRPQHEQRAPLGHISGNTGGHAHASGTFGQVRPVMACDLTEGEGLNSIGCPTITTWPSCAHGRVSQVAA